MKQKPSKKKIEYMNSFNKKKYKRCTLLIPLTEEKILKKLEEVPSKSAYLLSLIKKDIS